MIDLNTSDLLIEEKFKIKIFQKKYAYVRPTRTNLKSDRFNLIIDIKRFLAKDIYSIYSQYGGNLNIKSRDHEYHGHSLVNIINNKIKLQKSFLLGQKDYNLWNGELMFHHSEIQQKFRETNYLFSFLRLSKSYVRERNLRFYNNSDDLQKLVSYAFFLEFPNILKMHKVSSESLVQLKFIKNINLIDRISYFILKINDVANNNKSLINRMEQNKVIKPLVSYSNFFIKFHKLNLSKHNFKLATIYWKPNDKTDVFNSDFLFNNKSYIKVGSKKYKLMFQKSKNLEKEQKAMKENGNIEVGTLVLPEFTSYDFEKKKVTNDVDEFSDRGLLVPFDFKGDFFYQMHISINDVFKDLDFFVHQKVNEKKLDLYEGQIKIKIIDDSVSFNNNNENNIFVISSDFFKKILELGEFINPIAIIRISNEEEEQI